MEPQFASNVTIQAGTQTAYMVRAPFVNEMEFAAIVEPFETVLEPSAFFAHVVWIYGPSVCTSSKVYEGAI